MNLTPTLDRRRAAAKHRPLATSAVLAIAMATGLAVTPTPAHAVDGCLVLLCLAAPSWRHVAQCVAPVRQVLRDLARGRLFPGCGMAGGASSAVHTWASAPTFCPAQYTRSTEGESGTIYQCDFQGAVTVDVNGSLFSRTWWRMNGDAVTEFSPAAKAQLGQWDPRFDTELAAWLASQPASPPPPPPAAPSEGGG